jgi:TetR/AcrR family transcriptional regulator
MVTRGGTPRRTPAPTERKRDPERTKQHILEAAIDEFSRKGYAGARVADIATLAGVNQQLISYYFGGKAGLAHAIGRQWRAYETGIVSDEASLAEQIQAYGSVVARDPRLLRAAKLLAWEGLEQELTNQDEAERAERSARLRSEVDRLSARQTTGEIDETLDPAALLLILMSAGAAPAVYPQLLQSLYGVSEVTPEFIERYSAQLARVVSLLKRKEATS